MTGAAGLGLFHFRHGETLVMSQVIDGVMANPAIVVIFTEVDVMAEHHRFGIFEGELDILGFLGVRHAGG